MKFSELLKQLPQVVAVTADIEVSAPVTERVQSVQPGGVFVARRGAAFDGHKFISQAIGNGASAIVGELPVEQVNCRVPYAHVADAQQALGPLAAAYYGHPARKLVLIGVTGTDGKTTTVTLIYNILKAAGIRAGMISTVNAVVGDAEISTGLHVTTPSAPEVQQYLAQMVEMGMTHCVLEATSHGLAQGRLNGVDFDVAVMTNVMHEHLDYHGSWEAYRAAKARLFESLSTSYRKDRQRKVAIINADDSSAAYFGALSADIAIMYGLQAEDADIRAEDVEIDHEGIQFTIGGVLDVRSPMVGAFNVSNLLAAISVGIGLEVPQRAIARGILKTPPIIGRMDRIDEGQDFLAVVDFAHTPNSLRQALMAARRLIRPGKRVIAVFGSAGRRDKAKRRMMAEIAAELADVSVLTAEDPRTESLDDILEEMAEGCRVRGGIEGKTFHRVPDRGEAVFRAVQLARVGDIVMVCGKGHEQSMCFGDIEYPWDDREATRAALRGQPLRSLPTASKV